MPVVKIRKRGVIALPADICKRSGLKEGDDLLIDLSESGAIYI